MTGRGEDTVFTNVQVGRGLRVLAQHGSVIIGADGLLRLIGTTGDTIDSAPITETHARRLMITAGQTVALRMNGTTYNVTPWWDVRRPGGIFAPSTAWKLVSRVRAGR